MRPALLSILLLGLSLSCTPSEKSKPAQVIDSTATTLGRPSTTQTFVVDSTSAPQAIKPDLKFQPKGQTQSMELYLAGAYQQAIAQRRKLRDDELFGIISGQTLLSLDFSFSPYAQSILLFDEQGRLKSYRFMDLDNEDELSEVEYRFSPQDGMPSLWEGYATDVASHSIDSYLFKLHTDKKGNDYHLRSTPATSRGDSLIKKRMMKYFGSDRSFSLDAKGRISSITYMELDESYKTMHFTYDEHGNAVDSRGRLCLPHLLLADPWFTFLPYEAEGGLASIEISKDDTWRHSQRLRSFEDATHTYIELALH